jgi:tripartite-type tricarboxylate transporter receptor subunit TctC
MKRHTLKVLAGLFLSAGLSSVAIAADPAVAKLKPKDFPNQPIEYTVVYPAGGGMDLTARMLAKFVEKASGDKILVNNRTGGGGMVGHTYLATQAKNDGYTVGIVANLLWGDALLRAQGKWSLADLEPIGYVNSDALIWLVQGEGVLKGKSLKEIMQIAKDKPNTLRVATVPGTMWEYLVEQLEATTGGKFLRVPFQGGGPGLNALAGGNVDIAQGFIAEFRGLAEAGKVAPVAVAASERLPHLKNIPTFNEQLGTKDFTWQVVRYAVVPKGMAADRKAYLSAAISAAMRDPELIAEYSKAGVFFDSTLMKSSNIAKDINDYAEKERSFYVNTGRIK